MCKLLLFWVFIHIYVCVCVCVCVCACVCVGGYNVIMAEIQLWGFPTFSLYTPTHIDSAKRDSLSRTHTSIHTHICTYMCSHTRSYKYKRKYPHANTIISITQTSKKFQNCTDFYCFLYPIWRGLYKLLFKHFKFFFFFVFIYFHYSFLAIAFRDVLLTTIGLKWQFDNVHKTKWPCLD